ncbi:MAG: xanthine dehydrogenase family protein molybdopterin-binding subunit, partial [Gemmatimonadetes bacterium]|nr:xanthine dehydrogenase family protein molybdopterin-binding subunit [Gemmatimonadota bacterium]
MTVRKLDRRDFVKIGLTTGGGLALGISFATKAGAEAGPLGGPLSGADVFQPNAFLRLDPDGSLTIWCGKADMGQGVRTSLPMIVADEMDADWSRVETVQADAHPEKYGRQMTVGSSSVRRGGWTGLRVAGASAREMLVAAGAAALGVPASELTTRSGRVIHEGSGRSMGYGELAVAASEMPVPESPRLKTAAEFTLIGTNVPLVDTEEKVTGRAVFGLDVRVPGMLFATVAKPQVLGGSLVSMDEAAARAVPGVRDVFAISSGIAVVAENTWAAFEGAKALDCRWESEFSMSSPEISAHTAALCEGDAEVALEVGDAPGALAVATEPVTATYEVPYLAHATMEPMNCTAHVQEDRAEIWAPTQNPQGAQETAARLTGLPVERVTTHVTYMGCGWGRRSRPDFVIDAVETAMKLDVPVQVTWSREDDMRNDQYRPASMIRFRGAVEGGRLHALTARVAGPPLGVTDPRGRGGTGVDRNAVDGVVTMTYMIPNLLVDYARSEIQVPTGYWRSVGPSGNCFMVESFIDELAYAAGRD